MRKSNVRFWRKADISDRVKLIVGWKRLMPLLRSLLAALALIFLAQSALAADAVPSAAAAIKIGAAALKEKLGKKAYSTLMQNMTWEATAENDVWHVLPLPKSYSCEAPPGQECVMLPMGGWDVTVSRHDGRVISVEWER